MALAYKLMVFIILSLVAAVSTGANDTGLVVLSYQCSSDTYGARASYGETMSTFIKALVDSTTNSDYDYSPQSMPSSPGLGVLQSRDVSSGDHSIGMHNLHLVCRRLPREQVSYELRGSGPDSKL